MSSRPHDTITRQTIRVALISGLGTCFFAFIVYWFTDLEREITRAFEDKHLNHMFEWFVMTFFPSAVSGGAAVNLPSVLHKQQAQPKVRERIVTGSKLPVAIDADDSDAFVRGLPNLGRQKKSVEFDDVVAHIGYMRTGPEGIALIQSFEQLRLKAYKPHPKDRWTIGWGHTAAAGDPGVYPGMVITAEQADRIFERDLAVFEAAVNRAITEEMTQYQFDAFVSLAYNIGGTEFAKSTAARRFNAGDIDDVGEAIKMWKKSGGKVMAGLVRRRAVEVELFDGQGTMMAQTVEADDTLALT